MDISFGSTGCSTMLAWKFKKVQTLSYVYESTLIVYNSQAINKHNLFLDYCNVYYMWQVHLLA